MPDTTPRPVHVRHASDIQTSGGQTDGMTRQNAIVSLCPNLCASVMLASPHSSSAIHHHGSENTIVYAVSGTGGAVISEGGKKKQKLAPGDFALIPAFAEHQEVNEGDDEVKWVITRSGESPIVVNLEGWGGKEVEG